MGYAANTPSNCTVNRVLPKSFGGTPPRNQHPRVSLASCVPAALLLSLALSGYALAAPPAHEPSDEGPWAKGRILVMPRAGLSDTEFAKILGAHGGQAARKLGNLNIHVVELPPSASEKAVAKLLSLHPHIKFAEPDQLVAPDLGANDIYYGSAWHLQMVQAPIAWDYSLGAGVTVAILDSGVDASHPDLQGQLVPGWNFWDNNNDTTDYRGHGTLVAGVVAAAGNNSIGVTSMAWNAKIMPIRVSDLNGYGSWSAMASGLSWAADRGAKVANISFMVHSSSTVQSAAQYMRNKGGVVVNSAGNTGGFDPTAASDSLISVSATDSGDARAGWSTYGSHVDFSAPGVGIWSTAAGGGYSAVSGTSF
ncbi:MAG: S8 family serine peptidase, partial [Betaproteobacteria bacterium]|nr:S8 family serine peptidase [Betaproteobacteria bacterium]